MEVWMKTHKALAALAIAAFGLWTTSAAFAQSGPSPTGAVEVTPAKPPAKKATAKPAAVKGTVSTTTIKPVAATPAKSGTPTTTVKPVTATTTKTTTTKTVSSKKEASASASKVGARSVIGEVVDPACWLVNGAKGPSHKECAIACAKAGQVLGIVENKTQKLYVVANDKPGEDPNKGLVDYVGQIVLVKGRVYSRGGVTGIKVTSVEPYSATASAE
jgi:hypothetical protein